MANDPSGINWDEVPESAPGINWDEVPAKKSSAPAPSTWQQIKGMLPNLPYGPALEAATGLGSGMIAAPLSGLAGIAGGVRSFLPGGHEGQGADWVHATQDALTYEPTSKSAQNALKVLSYPGEKLGEAGDWAGGKATDWTGSPLVGTAVNTAIQGLPMLFGAKLPGARVSAFEKMLPGGEFPKTAPARAEAMAANAMRDDAVAADRAAGFKLSPTAADPTSWWNRGLEWAGGRKKLAQDLSKENQPEMQAKVRRVLGMAPNETLDLDSYGVRRNDLASAYPELVGAAEGAPYSDLHTPPSGIWRPEVVTPGINVTKEFRTEVGARRDAMIAELKDSPPTFNSLKSSLELLDDALSKNEIDPQMAVRRIQRLREDAKHEIGAPKPGTVELAHTRLQLASDIEGLIEQNLTEKGDFTSLAKFRDARRKIAQSYDAEKATLDTGEIYAKSLGDSSSPLSGELADIAHLAQNNPEVTQIPTRVDRTAPQRINPIGSAAGVVAHAFGGSGLLPAIGHGIQYPLRALLKSEMFQNAMVNPPSYGPSLPSRFTRGLQQPGVIPGLEGLGLDERRAEMLRQLLGASQ